MKPTKKKPAKRAVRTGSIEHKVMNLKNRINDCYATPAPDGRVNPKLTSTSDGHLGLVNKVLLDIRNNNWNFKSNSRNPWIYDF